MKGGPTDPPNLAWAGILLEAFQASMKGGPTDPPNLVRWGRLAIARCFNEGGAY